MKKYVHSFTKYAAVCCCLLPLLLALTAPASAQQRAAKLWYKQPAQQWVEALPLGNGRLGAMVFGAVEHERIQLNEGTIWNGDATHKGNPGAREGFLKSRELVMQGKIVEAQKIVDEKVLAVPRRMPNYQTLGDLKIDFSGAEPVQDYRRELDLNSGIARVSYKRGGTAYTREVLASYPDQLIVVRLTADKPGQLSFRATLTRPADAQTTATAPNRVVMSGQAKTGWVNAAGVAEGVRFRAELQALNQGGRVSVDGDAVKVEDANSVTLVLAAATNIRSTDLAAACAKNLQSAAKGYAALRAASVADVSALMQRANLKLGAGEDPLASMPTDERLKQVAAGKDDPRLFETYFQYARYLLVASSRPGSGGLAATLQGLWNESLTPAWGSKYTININTEMNYWLAGVGNLAELDGPMFDLVENARKNGERVAREYYGARGFVIHHNTDLWGDAVPIDGVKSGMWPMGAAWLCTHIWDHYQYTGDRQFLATRYPLLHGATEFLLDYITDDGKGHLVTGPSLSPENRYKLADGTPVSLSMGPTMDIEITRALFQDMIEASKVLGKDAEFRERVQKALDKLPPFQVGRLGQLQEWQQDYEEETPGHRHISHLWALHPGEQITLRKTPELAKAARVTLERRLEHGGGQTGWSRAWVVNYWARFEEGDKAYDSLMVLLRQSTFPNLFDSHPPEIFQIDGNFGGAAGMAEMLMQSHSGEVYFLPALPKQWDKGSFTGLRARGGMIVDLAWDGMKAKTATLHATTTASQRLRAPNGQQIRTVRSGGRVVPVQKEKDGSISFKATAGRSYQVEFL